MRRIVVFAFVFLMVSAALSSAQEMGKMKADPGLELKNASDRGKALFMDTSLGTNGMSCNSCHAEGGMKAGKMGDMAIPPFAHVGKKYPKYFKMAGKVMTLDQVINFCITTPMEGKALAWDDQRMADLAAYIVSVNSMKDENPESMDMDKMEKEKSDPKK